MKDRLTANDGSKPPGKAMRSAGACNPRLSGLAEAPLRGRGRATPSFVERWAGRLSVVPDDPRDRWLAALKAKHHLP